MTPVSARLCLALGALCAILPLASCVTAAGPASAPIPLGEGVYSLGANDAPGYQRAISFCFDQGRQLLRLNADGAGMPGQSGEIRFRCVGPGEPGWKVPAG